MGEESLEQRVEKWNKNYFWWRRWVNKAFFDRNYNVVQVEGKLPTGGPRFLMPTHQYSSDSFALIRAIDEHISFIYTVDQPWKAIPMSILPSAGSIRTYVKGISAKRHSVRDWVFSRIPLFNTIWSYYSAMSRERIVKHATEFRQALSDRFEYNGLVVGFPQGDFEDDTVSLEKVGLVNIIRRYERKNGKQVSIIPVGIEYKLKGSRRRSLFRIFKNPPKGTEIILRFGEPQYTAGKDTQETVESVMKESARLSNLPYNHNAKSA